MCLKDEKALPGDGKAVAVYSRDGRFYGQALEDPRLEMENGCRQMAFFHFQEWKKLWEQRGTSVAPLLKGDTLAPPAFRISCDESAHASALVMRVREVERESERERASERARERGRRGVACRAGG
eukprot:541743-Prymnesium_polylepis.2